MMSKLRQQGCPMDSIEAARAWRAQWVKPTMQGHAMRATAQAQALPTSGVVAHANAAMRQAGQCLAAGQNIDALMPALRLALAAVPEPQRDQVKLEESVLAVLTKDSYEAFGKFGWAGHIDLDFYKHAILFLLKGEAAGAKVVAGIHRHWYRIATGQIFAKAPRVSNE